MFRAYLFLSFFLGTLGTLGTAGLCTPVASINQKYVGRDEDEGRKVELELTSSQTFRVLQQSEIVTPLDQMSLSVVFRYGYVEVNFPVATLEIKSGELTAQNSSNPRWTTHLKCFPIQFPASLYKFTCNYWYNGTPQRTIYFNSDGMVEY